MEVNGSTVMLVQSRTTLSLLPLKACMVPLSWHWLSWRGLASGNCVHQVDLGCVPDRATLASCYQHPGAEVTSINVFIHREQHVTRKLDKSPAIDKTKIKYPKLGLLSLQPILFLLLSFLSLGSAFPFLLSLPAILSIDELSCKIIHLRSRPKVCGEVLPYFVGIG